MEEANKIVNDIKNKSVKPIYFLMGEESYYIDRISGYIEHNLLGEGEKSFNQQVLYGLDVNMEEIMGSARRYPMMAEYQVIIVKEAQHLSRNIEKLVVYAENPLPTTVLVFCYKYKTLDKRKKLYKTIKKTGVVFESKPLYDNQVPTWIKNYLSAKGYTIAPKATQMLVEFLGADLGKITNELEKLQVILPSRTQISPELIEENIGISKDFNNFELRKAIGERDVTKAHRIVAYFGQNPRDNPMVVTVGLVFSLFSQVLQYHSLTDKSKANVASKLKINPYFVGDYVTAARNYPMKTISRNISLLREADVKSKGVGANSVSQGDLLKELLVKLMN